ncbi:uncharacterized protein LOC124690725 [Lolium rigidum]|uniref:uncharacterized protein LOC124690725 n=1 Tax=Lolium rigidum TaxID=89674 RepID=UPI001F5D8E74|nr:uncharacterized protein LOC124690725 [Lolium rigidum]
MALQRYHHDGCCLLPPPLLPDWDWEWELRCTLGDDAAARDSLLIHDAFTALPSCGESPASSSSEASSGSGGGGGYLEDAVAHWSDRCKRRRTEEEEAPPPRWPAMASEDLQSLLQSFWDPSSGEGDLVHGLNTTMVPDTEIGSFASGEVVSEGEAGEDAAAAAGPPPPFSATGAPPPGSSPLQKATTGGGSHYCDQATSSSSSSLPAPGKRDGVMYPFAVVKPLVLEGSTLSDVNRRMLKRPARPVRHPVGQFACGPVVSSAHGPGLSGKAVVSLTKIRTGGKGTITIIRTRG